MLPSIQRIEMEWLEGSQPVVEFRLICHSYEDAIALHKQLDQRKDIVADAPSELFKQDPDNPTQHTRDRVVSGGLLSGDGLIGMYNVLKGINPELLTEDSFITLAAALMSKGNGATDSDYMYGDTCYPGGRSPMYKRVSALANDPSRLESKIAVLPNLRFETRDDGMQILPSFDTMERSPSLGL